MVHTKNHIDYICRFFTNYSKIRWVVPPQPVATKRKGYNPVAYYASFI